MPKTAMMTAISKQCTVVYDGLAPLALDIMKATAIDDSHKSRLRAVDGELHKMGQLLAGLEKHINSWDGSTTLKTKFKSQTKLSDARNSAKRYLAMMKTEYQDLEGRLVDVVKEISAINFIAPARPSAGPPVTPARPTQGPPVPAGKH